MPKNTPTRAFVQALAGLLVPLSNVPKIQFGTIQKMLMKTLLAFSLLLTPFLLYSQTQDSDGRNIATITDNTNTTCSSTNLPSAAANPGRIFVVANTAQTTVVLCRSAGAGGWIEISNGAGVVNARTVANAINCVNSSTNVNQVICTTVTAYTGPYAPGDTFNVQWTNTGNNDGTATPTMDVNSIGPVDLGSRGNPGIVVPITLANRLLAGLDYTVVYNGTCSCFDVLNQPPHFLVSDVSLGYYYTIDFTANGPFPFGLTLTAASLSMGNISYALTSTPGEPSHEFFATCGSATILGICLPTLADMPHIAAGTVYGNTTGGTAAPTAISDATTVNGQSCALNGTCTVTAAPSGTAGGDLSGSYPNPTVAKLDTVPFCTGFTPTNSQVLQYTTASSPNPCYTAVTVSTTGTAGGDLSGTYPNPTVVKLDTVPFCTGFTPTNGQAIQYTTGSSPNPCYTAAIISAAGTAGGDLSGTYPNPTVVKLDAVPFCTGYTPTNGQAIQYTTGSTPNPCYTAATAPGGTVTIETGGTSTGTPSGTLNFVSTNAITQNCTYNGGASRNDCTPDVNTATIPSVTNLQEGKITTVFSTNGTSGYTGCPVNGAGAGPTALTSGMVVWLNVDSTNASGAASFNYCTLGVISIKPFSGSSDPTANVIPTSSTFPITYDGTYWRLPQWMTTIGSTINCSSSASPAVCAAAPAGSVAIPTGISSVALTVNTTAVTANSQIFLFSDDSLGTKLGITCNSTLATLVGGMAITARTPGASFTVTYNGTIATNPLCASYLIIN